MVFSELLYIGYIALLFTEIGPSMMQNMKDKQPLSSKLYYCIGKG